MRITSSTLAMAAQSERTETVRTRIEGTYFVDRAGGRDTVRISSEAERQSALRAVVSASVGRSAGLREPVGNAAANDLRDWLALSRERALAAPVSGTRLRGGSERAGAVPVEAARPPSLECEASGEGDSLCGVSDDQLLGSPGGAKLVMLRRLVEALTGTRISIVRASDLGRSGVEVEPAATSQSSAIPASGEPAVRAGFGLELQMERVTSRSEAVSFSAAGTLVTGDGRTLTLDFSLAMSRTEVSVERMEVRMGDAQLKDPLVLMSTAGLAELGDRIKEIDLDRDGTLDRLPLVRNGAYLVLDRDGSGNIDHAEELFGAVTGDGFAELARLDIDHNGFIDEADPAYENLRLLRASGEGESLQSLRDAKVGAIATMSQSTVMSLETNLAVTGKLRATGIYLTEDGQVLPVEQVDVKA